MVPLSVESELKSKAKEIDLNLIGIIPYDGVLMEFNMRGKNIFDLPSDSEVNIAVEKIMIQTGIIGRNK